MQAAIPNGKTSVPLEVEVGLTPTMGTEYLMLLRGTDFPDIPINPNQPSAAEIIEAYRAGKKLTLAVETMETKTPGRQSWLKDAVDGALSIVLPLPKAQYHMSGQITIEGGSSYSIRFDHTELAHFPAQTSTALSRIIR